MKVRVEIISEQDVKTQPESARQSVHVAAHSRRGDGFNIDNNDTVMEGSDMVFHVPAGGRLVIDTPQVREELVYDRDQAASVRMSQQLNSEGRPDTADLDQVAKDKQNEADRAKQQAEDAKQRQEANKAPPPPNNTNPTAAAQQQRTTEVRPAGEKPPLPGSPVGSPPSGYASEQGKAPGSGVNVQASSGAARSASPTVSPTKDK